jgi:hypothetical protein
VSVIERYRVQERMDTETVFVFDNDTGNVLARCDTAETAGLIAAALNDHTGAVSEARTQAIRDVILMLRDSGIGRDARVADHIERHMLGGQS